MFVLRNIRLYYSSPLENISSLQTREEKYLTHRLRFKNIPFRFENYLQWTLLAREKRNPIRQIHIWKNHVFFNFIPRSPFYAQPDRESTKKLLPVFDLSSKKYLLTKKKKKRKGRNKIINKKRRSLWNICFLSLYFLSFFLFFYQRFFRNLYPWKIIVYFELFLKNIFFRFEEELFKISSTQFNIIITDLLFLF